MTDENKKMRFEKEITKMASICADCGEEGWSDDEKYPCGCFENKKIRNALSKEKIRKQLGLNYYQLRDAIKELKLTPINTISGPGNGHLFNASQIKQISDFINKKAISKLSNAQVPVQEIIKKNVEDGIKNEEEQAALFGLGGQSRLFFAIARDFARCYAENERKIKQLQDAASGHLRTQNKNQELTGKVAVLEDQLTKAHEVVNSQKRMIAELLEMQQNDPNRIKGKFVDDLSSDFGIPDLGVLYRVILARATS